MEASMSGFIKQDIVVDGVRVQVLEAGRGEPLVYFHGAGTMSGMEELLPLAKDRRLIVPYHPGFGPSDDDSRINSILDYVVHYAALFDHLGLLEPVDLVGHSLGGWMASMFAIFKGHRVRRLALACPSGLRVAEHPTTDLFTIRAEKFLPYLVANPEILARMASTKVTNEMKVARYREMTSLARVAWDRNYEPKFDRWLAYVKNPTLILWGEQDRVIPVQQANFWANRIANSEIATFEGAGHLLFLETSTAIGRLEAFLDGDTGDLKKLAG
jgi:pimeloyl-ACP methyl ester carboxylesterase